MRRPARRCRAAAAAPAAAARARSGAATSRSGSRKRSSDASIRRSISGTGSPGTAASSCDVLAVVAVLGRRLTAPDGLDRGAEALHLRARVVVVVLALDLVAAELEQPRDRVAVGAVAAGRDGDRAGGVRGDHLHLDALARLSPAAAVALPASSMRPERAGEPPVAEEEVDEARAGDLGPLDVRQLRGDRGDLDRELARRPFGACRRGAARRSSRSRRGRVARPLELESAPIPVGERVRERPRRDQPATASRGAKRSSSRRISSGEPTPISTSPTSSGVSGSGVVSKVPSGLRSATTIAPVSWRIRSSRIVRSGGGRRRAHLDLGELEVRAGRGRDDVEEGGHLRLEHEVRHHLARGRVRKHDPVGARELQLALRRRVGGARDDRQARARGARRERDVEVVRVGVGGRDQPARPLEPGARQVGVLGRVALHEQVAVLLGRGDRVLAVVEDDVADVRVAELLGHAAADAAVAADDEVVVRRSIVRSLRRKAIAPVNTPPAIDSTITAPA